MKAVISSAPPQIPEPNAFASYNIYRSADKCPFSVFEKCLCDEDYSGLGDAPPQILAEAWMNIYFEYLKLTDDGSTTDKIKHLGHIQSLSAKIQVSKMLASSMAETGFEILIPVLHDLGYKFVKSIEDIPRIVALIKREEVNMNILINNLPKNTGNKMDKKVFDDILFRLSEHLHFIIHKDKITVSEYCSLVNGYRKHIELQQQQQLKAQSHGGRSHK
jgi:hypothetical protein